MALIRLRGEAAAKRCRFLFSGDVADQPVKELKRFCKRMRAQADIPDARIHDLRQIFASLLVCGRAALEMIGRRLKPHANRHDPALGPSDRSAAAVGVNLVGDAEAATAGGGGVGVAVEKVE